MLSTCTGRNTDCSQVFLYQVLQNIFPELLLLTKFFKRKFFAERFLSAYQLSLHFTHTHTHTTHTRKNGKVNLPIWMFYVCLRELDFDEPCGNRLFFPRGKALKQVFASSWIPWLSMLNVAGKMLITLCRTISMCLERLDRLSMQWNWLWLCPVKSLPAVNGERQLDCLY